MTTLVISDLHLGIHTGADVLCRPAALDVLLGRLDGVDRLVLLGDVLELRGGPARAALAAAEPVMRAIGDALGPDGEVLIAAGNHDHAIAAGWLDWRGRRELPEPLALEQRVAPARASWIAKRLAGWLAPASTEIVYPGVWLRDDVYATHGHYLDVHTPIPTLERLAAGVMGRMAGELPEHATAEDYEARLAPIYAWIHATAQRTATPRRAVGMGAGVRVWTAIEGARSTGATGPAVRPRRAAARYARVAPFRLAVAAANRAGLGPVQSDIAPAALRDASLDAVAELLRRLRLTPDHLVFGHTHRTGLLAGDDAGRWRTPAGTQLHNAGSWVFETHFMGSGPRGENPYWPGGAVVVDDEGPPRLQRLLGELPAGVLSGPAGRQ